MIIPQSLLDKIDIAIKGSSFITFLVGAGISAESGIPTFRGAEGYWKIGYVNYKPQEIGNYKMFHNNPIEVWKWFLFRKTVCRNAKPNAGHYALKNIEDVLGNRFALISQNVDGLHKRAGNTLERTYLIHGDLDYVRCGNECKYPNELYPFPNGIADKSREDLILKEELTLLKCPKCGKFLRPHVLWFDEYYEEEYYKSKTVMKIAENTSLLFVIGTSGATNLPHQIAMQALNQGCTFVVIDVDENIFSEVAQEYENGYFLKGKSGEILPELYRVIKQKYYE